MMRRVSAGVAARVGRGGLGVEETSQRVDVSISHLGGRGAGGGPLLQRLQDTCGRG